MNAYRLEALTEKLKDERILHGPDLCIYCANGEHEVAGNAGCECPCHLPPASAGEISA